MNVSRVSTNETITFIAAILQILLFGYAAVSKMAEYDRFVAQMKLVPVPVIQHLAVTLGWLIPLIEIIIVLLLCSDRWRNGGLFASFLLLLSFEIYISAMMLSGLELPCTCGGLISKLQWGEHLVFNALFMLISIFPFIYKFFQKKYTVNILHKKVGIDI